MGHALNGSIQDCLVRWHRMRGFDTLWQPGYDHAGISTQNVVEKQLDRRGDVAPGDRPRGVPRAHLGLARDRRAARSWASSAASAPRSTTRASASRWTTPTSRAVMTFFVRLWERGWIYRANRIVNWCPHHQTAISDLEVEHVEMDDTLTYARYPFADGSGSITVATVRPATILADVAVAVHPDDERYRDAVGKRGRRAGRRAARAGDRRRARRAGVRHGRAQDHAGPRPDRLRDRPRPRPADAHRDRPRRPDDRRGLRGARPGGGRRARRRVAARSTASSRSARATGTRSARASAATRGSSRSSRRSGGAGWTSSARPAIEALRERRVRFHPESQHRFAIESLESAPDWCVSRQLWWGHQIPIWTCPDGHETCRVAAARRRAPSAAPASSSATPTCSTPGSRRRSGRSRRSAGRRRRPSSRATTPATST